MELLIRAGRTVAAGLVLALVALAVMPNDAARGTLFLAWDELKDGTRQTVVAR